MRPKAHGDQGFDYQRLARRFREPAVRAIALMGSRARGDAGPFSDIDLVRFVDEGAGPPGTGSHVVDGILTVVSDVTPSEAEAWFTDPLRATECVVGARTALPLWDPQGWFHRIQERARAFVWDASMQAGANAYASRELAGWVEEAHKGLEGLRRDDVGRLLSARFGLSWGLAKIMRVQRGVLLTGENAFLEELLGAIGPDSAWGTLCRGSFGLSQGEGRSPSLREQVQYGLRLFALTAEMLSRVLEPEQRPVVDLAVRRIREQG